ncbi:hypothetical protein J437_LFUL016588 [Ladona fulva]|uniref:Prefoldin subunit 3 n=1 Tax=Ladona fulva TaxID=123851 RepID=A0A8K0JWV3_LADFU|nr:hypothetical protein J437_LFUL016588 [Ladona fulva]
MFNMAAGQEETGNDEKKKSFSGIPEAAFVDDVDAFVVRPENNSSVNFALARLDEQHGKYKFMELHLLAKRGKLKSQLPDMEHSQLMIQLLRKHQDSRNDIETQFLLSEQVFMKALVPPTDKVCLWLGANVMLEYTLDDAAALLSKNIETAKKNLGYVEHDLDFLRDQLTTTEVNMARVYNWDVKSRQAAKKSGTNQ